MWHGLPWPGMGETATRETEIFLLRNSLRLETLWGDCWICGLWLSGLLCGSWAPPWPLPFQAAGVGGAQDQNSS